MTVNERIKKVRIDQDLSQQKFADKINLSANFINLIERGTRNASDRTLNDIAAKFSVNLEWLRTGKGDMYDEESEDVIITALKSEYNLDDIDIEIIRNYINMAPLERQVFKTFINNVAGKKKRELKAPLD